MAGVRLKPNLTPAGSMCRASRIKGAASPGCSLGPCAALRAATSAPALDPSFTLFVARLGLQSTHCRRSSYGFNALAIRRVRYPAKKAIAPRPNAIVSTTGTRTIADERSDAVPTTKPKPVQQQTASVNPAKNRMASARAYPATNAIRAEKKAAGSPKPDVAAITTA